MFLLPVFINMVLYIKLHLQHPNLTLFLIIREFLKQLCLQKKHDITYIWFELTINDLYV